MCLHDGAAAEHVSEVELIRELVEDLFEDARNCPSAEPFEDAPPCRNAPVRRARALRRGCATVPPRETTGPLPGGAGIGRLAGQHGAGPRPHGARKHRPVFIHADICLDCSCRHFGGRCGETGTCVADSQVDCQQAPSGPDFRQTWIWRQAFEIRRSDSTTEEQEYFRTQYLSIRDRSAQLVSRIAGDIPGLTVHDISHLDALWDMASAVAEGAVNVNPAEAFVLGPATPPPVN